MAFSSLITKPVTHFPTPSIGTLDTISVNSANVQIGICFQANSSISMTGFKLKLGANAGTVTNILQADLYLADANGKPTGSSLATVTTTPSASAINTFTWSAAYSVSGGLFYFIVIKNIDGTPATNRFSVSVNSATHTPYLGHFGTVSLDAGSTWYSSGNLSFGFWFNSSSGTDGFVIATGATSSGSVQLYNASGSRTARIANRYRFGNPVILYGLNYGAGLKTGSPTFNAHAEVCSASAVLYSGLDNVNAANMGGANLFLFDGGVSLDANTDYYIGVTPTGATAGDSSNRINPSTIATVTAPTNVDMGSQCFDGYSSTASGNPSWSALGAFLFCTLLISPQSGGSGGAAPNAIRSQGQEGVLAA